MTTKLVKNGSTVKLFGLKAAEWNGQTGVIVESLQEGRFPVQVTGREAAPPINIKPANCAVVCSGCLGDAPDGLELKACSRCRAACYCGAACQKAHWATHKPACKKLTADLADLAGIEASGFHDDLSWRAHLTLPQRRFLRAHHAKTKCARAWPVSGLETDAMLTCHVPSFLLVHPNQRFKVAVQELPSFQMQYPDGMGVSGKVFPAGQMLPVLREEWRRWEPPPDDYDREWYAENTRRYQEMVPVHAPSLMVFAVVREVVWTQMCQLQMLEFYARPSNKGHMFAWPAGECVGVCPGTGERVVPDDEKVHLLVACQMQGTVVRGDGVHVVTRIMPRVLTLKGYAAMLGSEDDTAYPGWQGRVASTLVRKNSRTGEMIGAPAHVSRPFYPDFLRSLVDAGRSPTHAMTTNAAWEKFHEEGRYLAFERMLQDDARKNYESGPDAMVKVSVSGPIVGKPGGPSTYQRKPT